MTFQVGIDGVDRSVEIEPSDGNALRVRLDNKSFHADVVRITPENALLLIDNQSFDAHVVAGKEGLTVRCRGREFAVEIRDPRAWRGGRGGSLGTEGRQKVAAPMPGKVVRVLVAAGDSVEANQGLLVVEAMKMQNEIRAPKSGTVERVLVREGQAVGAGETLVVVV